MQARTAYPAFLLTARVQRKMVNAHDDGIVLDSMTANLQVRSITWQRLHQAYAAVSALKNAPQERFAAIDN